MESLRWVNRRALALALLISLFGVCTAFHFQARTVSNLVKTLHGSPAFISDDLVVCRIRAVDWIQGHPWMPLLFALWALANLLWLESRQAPRWAVWTTLGGLALPCLAYIWVCLKASTLGFFVMGPAM